MMTKQPDFGWDYPPSVTTLPGDYDKDIIIYITATITIYIEDETPHDAIKNTIDDSSLNIEDFTIRNIENSTYTIDLYLTKIITVDAQDESYIPDQINESVNKDKYIFDDYTIDGWSYI